MYRSVNQPVGIVVGITAAVAIGVGASAIVTRAPVVALVDLLAHFQRVILEEAILAWLLVPEPV